MSQFLITDDISKNYILVKNIYITDNRINMLCNYGINNTNTIDISFQTIYDVSNIIQSIKILPILGNTDNLTIRQDVIDFSHKIVLLLSGSIKNGIWNKTNDMLARYKSLDYIEYIPNSNLYDNENNCVPLVDISNTCHTYCTHNEYNNIYDCSLREYDSSHITKQIENKIASQIRQPYNICDNENSYSLKTEFVNQPPPGINQLFNYILY